MYGPRLPYTMHAGTGIIAAQGWYSRWTYVHQWSSISLDENIFGVHRIFLVRCRCLCCQDLLCEPDIGTLISAFMDTTVHGSLLNFCWEADTLCTSYLGVVGQVGCYQYVRVTSLWFAFWPAVRFGLVPDLAKNPTHFVLAGLSPGQDINLQFFGQVVPR